MTSLNGGHGRKSVAGPRRTQGLLSHPKQPKVTGYPASDIVQSPNVAASSVKLTPELGFFALLPGGGCNEAGIFQNTGNQLVDAR
jgi:hypothetical protein